MLSGTHSLNLGGKSFTPQIWLTVGSFLLNSGASLLTVGNFRFFAYEWSFFSVTILAFYLQLELFCLQWESASDKRFQGL